MPKVLLTAFEPYGPWKANASWLALVELTKRLPALNGVTTRLLPVDFSVVREKLAVELAQQYDVVLHVGQAPGDTNVRLESIAVNVGGEPGQPSDTFGPLMADGPVAYRSALPLAAWAEKLRTAGIPAYVSYHAGTYLCNASLYFTHYFSERMGLTTKAAFVHVPLDVSQTVGHPDRPAAMPSATVAQALELLLEEIVHAP